MQEVLMIALPLMLVIAAATQAQPASDTPFLQETAERYSLGSPDANDVRSVAVDAQGSAWAATRAGVYTLTKARNRWQAMTSPDHVGPAFVVFADSRGYHLGRRMGWIVPCSRRWFAEGIRDYATGIRSMRGGWGDSGFWSRRNVAREREHGHPTKATLRPECAGSASR
ncbi:MAG: hypothetical protein KatS3mg022_1397 [Armatimonadota bacterium]|nr:MAG: hypothetical protein KatS3mg022_1397 [Armatimonadota bacterium]